MIAGGVLFLLQRFFITNSIDMELTIGAIFIMKVIQMKIGEVGEVSKKYNISIETLRFYDKAGLLVPERINNIRCYSERHIKKLKEILEMKKLMFTLDEIKGILELVNIINKIENAVKGGNLDG
jgi:hypothetical protein